MVKPGFYNYLITPSKSGEKVSGSKVPLVLLPHKAAFRAFEGVHLASDPYILVEAKIMVWALDKFLESRNASDYM